MMKRRKAAVFALLLAVCVIAVSVIPSLASNKLLQDNTVEDSSSSTWSDLTERGIKTIESEESGNQYLALTSSNGQYCDYRALKTRISGLLFLILILNVLREMWVCRPGTIPTVPQMVWV